MEIFSKEFREELFNQLEAITFDNCFWISRAHGWAPVGKLLVGNMVVIMLPLGP